MPQQKEQELRRVCRDYSKQEQALLDHAIELAYEGHAGQVRKSSNKPYVIHPMEIALFLQQRFDHAPLTVAGLLHDVVEDSDHIEIDQIYREFGDDIGFLVDAVTKTHLHFYKTNQHFDSYIDKLLFGGLHDVRVFLLKIADRDNNLLTLSSLKDHKQVRISFETQAVFSPLREILEYDNKKISLGMVTHNFMHFVTAHQLATPSALQQHLFHYSFDDFNRETFREVYANSEKIVWEIRDMARYETLCSNENFEKSVQVLSLFTDGSHFKVTFKFKGAHVLDQTQMAKFALSSFSAQTQS